MCRIIKYTKKKQNSFLFLSRKKKIEIVIIITSIYQIQNSIDNMRSGFIQMPLPLVVIDAPLVGALIAANIAAELWHRVDAFELLVTPKRTMNRVGFAALLADVRT